MTNRERVLDLIRQKPGLSDREIVRKTGISPHQQVNQICRLLVREGLTTRCIRTDGVLGNYPGQSTGANRASVATPRAPVPSRRIRSGGGRLPSIELDRALFVLPCSGRKAVPSGVDPGTMRSVLDLLPPALADELRGARRRNATRVRLDEAVMGAALEVYEGTLYEVGRPAIRGLMARGASVAIISGGYGLVLASEAIGTYNHIFTPSMWSGGLIGRCLAALADAVDASSVVGVLAGSTSYATVFRSAPWTQPAWLVTPSATTGAMVKAPRAQGEVLGAILSDAGPPDGWESSDGVSMKVTPID